MNSDQPYRAAHDLTGSVARLVATAFEPMPVVSWLVPTPHQRAAVLARQFRIIIEHAITTGRVDVLPGMDAAAVWLPAGEPDLPEIEDYDARLADACGEYVERFHALDAALHAHHPGAPAHEHLALLAVRAGAQCRGLGSRLLEHRHRILDAAERPAYLEASTMRSARLYERHGYRHIGPPFTPNGCPASFWPMWRDPQPLPAGPDVESTDRHRRLRRPGRG